MNLNDIDISLKLKEEELEFLQGDYELTFGYVLYEGAAIAFDTASSGDYDRAIILYTDVLNYIRKYHFRKDSDKGWKEKVDDAPIYALRGLLYLRVGSASAAEADCLEALKSDDQLGLPKLVLGLRELAHARSGADGRFLSRTEFELVYSGLVKKICDLTFRQANASIYDQSSKCIQPPLTGL